MTPTWVIHFIPCEQPSYHTHGVNAYESLELELKLPLKTHQAVQFINLIAGEIADKGKRYRSGDREDHVFNFPFYLFETVPIQPSRDNDRVLRVLFCDPAGKYPWEPQCKAPYSLQLNEKEKLEMTALLRERANGGPHAGSD